ncbi:MAG TPA: hypothetical protein VJN43_09995 [Bryobacteraceae bacterium]|nr:hypothetical protein [Bryobacteraceae bacterium]
MLRLCWVVLVASSAATLGWAQGSRAVSSESVDQQIDREVGPGAFAVTRTAKGKIAAVNKEDHDTIVVFEDSQGKRGKLKLTSKTRFRADKKTEYAGKKHISADDLEIGQRVKITFVASSGQVLEVRLIAKS